MDTFKSARLKLTGWYLLIVTILSLAFSIFIYKALTFEVDRFEKAQRVFIERRLREGDSSDSTGILPPPRGPVPFNPSLVAETKRRILWEIVFTNAGILIITGGLGYFLAGKTLQPIKKMVEEQDRFISDASHEFKTPLTVLRSEFEVATLAGGKLTLSEAKKVIKSGLEEIINLQKLTESLIGVNRYQKKFDKFKMRKVSLSKITAAALERVMPLAKQKQVKIKNEVQEITFKGDSQSLTELLVILLENAIKFSHQQSEVIISSHRRDGFLQIKVSDFGIGIDKKDLPYVFDRFYQADKSRSENQGYGLGLAIAKEIVEAYLGVISVKSEPNKGTTFTVRFPLV